MGVPLRVLIVEDQDDDVQLMLRALRQAGYEPAYEQVQGPDRMAQALAGGGWEVVLSDYHLPDFDAPHALEVLAGSGLDIPLIVVSGTIGEGVAVDMMKAGAHDYIMKSNLQRLAPAVERELREAEGRRRRRNAERALHEAESRYRSLVENMPAVSYLAAADGGEWLYISPRIEAMLGFSPDEWLNEPGRRLAQIHSDDRERVASQAGRSLAGGVAVPLEYRLLTRDGRVIWVQDYAGLVLDEMGHPANVQGVIVDVTERKNAEERLRRQLDRLSALRAVDMAISSSLDLTLTLSVLLGQVISQLGVDAADILLFNPATQTLTAAAGRGFRSTDLPQSSLRLGEGHAGRAALDRRIVAISDLPVSGDSASRTPLLAAEGFVSYVGVPLVSKGHVKGVLEVFGRSALRPDEEWLDFLQALSQQAAIALDDAELFENLQRLNTDLAVAYDATLEAWAAALEQRGEGTRGHTPRLAELTMRLGRMLGLGETELVHIRRGALLHDIGEIDVPDHIFRKPGSLTDDEWQELRRHPNVAYELLSPITHLRSALDIPYAHHEHWDGRGYPRGLAGEGIPVAARLFAVVDAWDALNSDRPHRKAWPEARARQHLRDQSGKQFDPQAVELLLAALREDSLS